MKISKPKSKRGSAMVIVITVSLVLAILGFSLLKLAGFEVSLGHRDIRKMKAFYFAESGLARYITNAYNGNFNDIPDTPFEEGSYYVEVYPNPAEPNFVIATGRAGREYKSIKVGLAFLAYPYEHAIFGASSPQGGGVPGVENWTLDLRGEGIPERVYIPGATGQIWRGGRDQVYGDVYARGNVAMYEESSVYPKYSENYDIFGDVEATGLVDYSQNVYGRDSISGAAEGGVDPLLVPDLVAMNYANNNSHDVSGLFGTQSTGRLVGHELYNQVVKNPSDRWQEVSSTAGDDYFFEPARITSPGSWNTASTPLRLSDGAVYYVDGDVWIHNPTSYGFRIDGKVTIVATGDIHISDNLGYANPQSALGLIALGKYDSGGNLISGGNIYFGDPRYGTTYTVDALMFAANDFLYCTDSITGRPGEPETGFKVYGNFAGMNHVSVNRDWYTPDGSRYARPAYYDHETSTWIDLENRTPLTQTELDNLRHYQMIINYDERIRDPEFQLPGLPRGPGTILSGIRYWEETLPIIAP